MLQASSLILVTVFTTMLSCACAVEFIILHANDLHGRFEQTDKRSSKCSAEHAAANKCYGGYARIGHLVKKHREEAKNGGLPVLFLNGGDTYTGTPWFSLHRYKIAADFENMLMPDAFSLGNHEFDDNVEGLLPFIKQCKFPVLACNLVPRTATDIYAIENFNSSIVLNVGGEKVGIIGYVTPDTKIMVVSTVVEFMDEIKCINREAKKLQKRGVNIIIALGHSGYIRDKEIAAACPLVDVVVGAHSHSFLYTGKKPDIETPKGPYPTVIRQKTGKKVPVVQAYCFSKYLGKLKVKFNGNGDLIKYSGAPILLNHRIPRDSDIMLKLEEYRPGVTQLEQTITGSTKVHLRGPCRDGECNIGNLITDAMVQACVNETQSNERFWTKAAIAFCNGGGIRSNIEKQSSGEITMADIMTVLPFENDIIVTYISGKTIRKALSLSLNLLNSGRSGGFLQMSGVQVIFNFWNKKKVSLIKVLCADCDVPKYERLDESKLYKVLVTTFLYTGGDGHKFREENSTMDYKLSPKDSLVLSNYLKSRDVVYPAKERRIRWVGLSGSEKKANMGLLLWVTICITLS